MTTDNPSRQTLLKVATVFQWLTVVLIILASVGCIGAGIISQIQGDETGFFGLLIFVIIGLLLLVPLAWAIPMAHMTAEAKNDSYRHLVLGVCSLFFTNFIAGILILIATGAAPAMPTESRSRREK